MRKSALDCAIRNTLPSSTLNGYAPYFAVRLDLDRFAIPPALSPSGPVPVPNCMANAPETQCAATDILNLEVRGGNYLASWSPRSATSLDRHLPLRPFARHLVQGACPAVGARGQAEAEAHAARFPTL